MEGRGVTNYSTDKSSYRLSTDITEFDDALISRGIITFEQAMIAKGASSTEALKLSQLHENEVRSGANISDKFNNMQLRNRSRSNDSSNDSSNDEDEEFIRKYREIRINELKSNLVNHKHTTKYGDVLCITRSDWNREVTEASKDGLWVIVNLTRSSSCLSDRHDELCDRVQEIVVELAERYEHIKFVSIPSNSAIENWPEKNLPTLFCYCFGKLQHQLVGIRTDSVEMRLATLGVLDHHVSDYDSVD